MTNEPAATRFAQDVLGRDWPRVVELEHQNDLSCDLYPGQEPRSAPVGSYHACQVTLKSENAALRRLDQDLGQRSFPGAGGDTITAFRGDVHQYLAATTRTYNDLAHARYADVRRDEFFPWPPVCVEPVNDMPGSTAVRFPEMPYNDC